MNNFDPTKFGATPIEDTSFNPNQFGAAEIAEQDDVLPWYKNLSQELWKDLGFGKIIASGGTLLAEGVSKAAELVGNKEFSENIQNQIDKVANEGIDFGSWGGKVKPIGGVTDAVSTGFKVGSSLVPIGKASVFTKPSVIAKMGNWLAGVSPFAITHAVGTGLETSDKGGTTKASAESTLGDLASSYLTLGLFKGGGKLLKYGGEQLLKTPIIQSIAEETSRLADDMYKTFSSARNTTAREFNSWITKFNELHKESSKAIGESLKESSASELTWGSLMTKVGDIIKKGYDSATSQYSDVYRPEYVIPKENAKNLIKELTNGLQKYGIEETEINKFLSQRGSGSPVGGILGNLIDKIKTIQFKNGGGISMYDVNSLWRDFGMGSANRSENQVIKNILMGVSKDGVNHLNSTPELKPVADRLLQANEFWSNLTKGLDNKFTNLMKASANPKDFVDNIFTKNPKDLAENIRLLVDGMEGNLKGLDDGTKKLFSKLLTNNLIDTTLKYSRNPSDNGKALKKFLDLWEPKGLLHPDDVDKLDTLADHMTGTFDDFSRELKVATQISEQMAPLKEVAEKVSNIQSNLKTIDSAFNSIEGKKLYQVKENGTYDFSNTEKFIEKINSDGRYDSFLEELNRYGDLSSIKSTKLAGIARTIVGSFVASTGHPVFGIGYALRGVSDLVGKTGGKITQKDVEKTMTTMLKNNDITGFQKVILNLANGSYDKAGSIIGKSATLTLDSFLKAAGVIKGGELSPEDQKNLQDYFEQIK